MATRACTRAAAELKVACSNCGLRELCLPVGFSDAEMVKLDRLVATRVAIPKGTSLFKTGDVFDAVFAIRAGFFKIRTLDGDGDEHVTGFQMAGEVLGLDGIAESRHVCDAVALEDSSVCVIPYSNLESLSREFTQLQRHFHRILGREIVREQDMMRVLSRMRADERVAAFLLNLAERLENRGFSSTSLVLRMTREEIGTYLGLQLETVSRCLSKFQEEGALTVQYRNIQFTDKQKLQSLLEVPA